MIELNHEQQTQRRFVLVQILEKWSNKSLMISRLKNHDVDSYQNVLELVKELICAFTNFATLIKDKQKLWSTLNGAAEKLLKWSQLGRYIIWTEADMSKIVWVSVKGCKETSATDTGLVLWQMRLFENYLYSWACHFPLLFRWCWKL